MTPKFTTTCYVRIDNEDKRREVIKKLQDIGYRMISPYEYPLIQCEDGWVNDIPFDDNLSGINCGSNTSLFLNLAGMRSDTDYMQLFKFDSSTELFMCKFNSEIEMWGEGGTLGFIRRRATATEIINHYKQKGE